MANTATDIQPTEEFDLEAWTEQKQERRQALYDTVDKMADKTLSDPAALSAYLDAQARLGKTKVSNTLIILASKPETTQVMSFDDWQKRGRSVMKGENGFDILESKGEYERDDGTKGRNFDPKRVFDISQTYGRKVWERRNPPIKSALKALTTNTAVPIRLSDNVPQGIAAEYSQMDLVVYVARNAPDNDKFFAIARELARAEQGDNTFLCDCTANIVCLRYGVPAKHCERLPEEVTSMDTREKRGALDMVRDTAVSAMERVDRNLALERQKDEPERERA